MFESNEIYFSDYNSPSIQTKKSGIKKSKKILFTPTDHSFTPKSKKSRIEKHLKTMKINPSFIHKFQSFTLEKNENSHSYTPIKPTKNKPSSFTDFIQPIILKNNKIKSYSNVQKKKYSKKTIKEILNKIKNIIFNFNNKIEFPFPEKIGNKNGLKRIVFFELDNVLLHTEINNYLDYEKIIRIKLPSGIYVNIGIDIRPHFYEMINMIKDNYYICIYTSCEKFYADYLIQTLDFYNDIFLIKLYRDKCFKICINEENIFIKDLRIINQVNIKDIIIVDSSAIHFGLFYKNGIPITPYNKKNKNDGELLNLGILLNNMYKIKNVDEFIESTFKSFY